MDVGLLYSGGKDSTLAGLFLEPYCSITAVCCSFGITADHEHAGAAAAAVGFDHETVTLNRSVAREAVDAMVRDGYPRNGIQQVHEHALEAVADREFDAIADGTRRDDRVPTVDRSLAQSIEDRYDVAHLAPLAGIGRRALDALASSQLAVETGPSETIAKGDYEAELRTLMAEDHGKEVVEAVFPAHEQSRVLGRKH